MIVTVDDREPSIMVGLLMAEGVEVVRQRLDVGDYVSGGVCVERKTIDDFCGSLVDGRLKRQVERMKEKFERVVVLVSGRVKDRRSEIHENCVLGKMLNLVMDDDVKLLLVDDDCQLAWVMKRLFERYEEMDVK